MKINEKICPIHGLLPNSYFVGIDREYYFILSCGSKKILAVKSYSKNKTIPQKNISYRIINGERYYRLLDDRSLRMPIILGESDIYRYFCPICKFDNNDDSLDYSLRNIIRKLSSELNCNLGISGSNLIGANDPLDYDIVLYNVEDVKNTVISLDKFKKKHNLRELRSWRRFVYKENIICLYLRQRYLPFYLERLLWLLDENSKPNLIKFKATDNSVGFAFPTYYKCIALTDSLKIKEGEQVIFASTQPGHSGLLKCGDEFTVQCYEFNINGNKAALADPCNSWIEV